MSKLKEHLNEAVNNELIEAWENSYLSVRDIKNAIGDMVSMSFDDVNDFSKEYDELMSIVAGLEKYYVKNMGKIKNLSKKIK